MAIIPKQPYGIKIAAPGFDVKTAPDYELLFNSSWPSLTTAFETSFTATQLQAFPVTIPSGGIGLTYTIPHNLGFSPLLIVYASTSGVGYGRYDAEVFFDNENIYFRTLANTIDGKYNPNWKFVVTCMNIDITKDNTYPNPQGGIVKQIPSNNFGIKVTKKGKNINSNDLNDYIIHSRAQSPALVQIVTNQNPLYYDPTTFELTYPLKTAYIPWFTGFSFSENNTITGQPIYFTIASQDFNIVNNSIIGTFGPTGTSGLVIMRDPLFPPTNVNVSY